MKLTDDQVRKIELDAENSLDTGDLVENTYALLADRDALLAERDNWIEIARQHFRNEEYYRGLGELYGLRTMPHDVEAEPRDRPANEIEITPEMIEAAEDVLAARYLELLEPSESQLLRRVAAEMIAAALRFRG